MRERELDEFGSLFKRAIIPTIEVERIAIRDIVVLADFSERARACGEVAAELAARFGSRVSVRFLLRPAAAARSQEAARLMESIPGDEHRLFEGDPTLALNEITTREKPSLILAPTPMTWGDESHETAALGEFVDRLLVATAIPTLLLRTVPEESVFSRILAKLPGGRHELIEQFSIAFALCRPGGSIRLLHVVDRDRLEAMAEALEIAPGIDTAGGSAELASALRVRMEQLLRGAIHTARDAAFEVEAAVESGDPFEIAARQARDRTLLIVGSQSHSEFLKSRAYEVIRNVPDIPVLAL